MIEDGQLLFDGMSGPLVVMELIACKCNRMCKGPECQWFSNALSSIHNASIGSFLSQGTSFYECKICGIILKVVSL